MKKEQKHISLVIQNTEMLEPDIEYRHIFYLAGGIIGSDQNSTWVLHNKENSIASQHAAIEFIDGHFCVHDLCGRTCMNKATLAIGAGKKARLNLNDTLSIGDYIIKFTFSSESSNETMALFEEPDTDIKNVAFLKDRPIEKDTIDNNPEILLSALDSRETVSKQFDTMGLSRNRKTGSYEENILSDSNHENWTAREHTQQANSEQEISTTFSLNITDMDHETLQDDKFTMSSTNMTDINYTTESYYLSAGSMLRGLDVSIGNKVNSENMQKLSEEVGASLQAAIKGFLSLHTSVSDSRYGLMNKNFQPIEDNPLRLGMQYDETMKLMFDEEATMVHLSAPAAIEESLESLKNHNKAIEFATSEALGRLLTALSPTSLQSRFVDYRHNKRNNNLNPDEKDAWSWRMYTQYYRELESNRQQGFEKLFWEIFDQAYDRKLRELQQGHRDEL